MGCHTHITEYSSSRPVEDTQFNPKINRDAFFVILYVRKNTKTVIELTES